MQRRKDQNFDRQLIGLQGPKSDFGDLPLVHVTAAWTSKEILRAGKLITKRCRVFGKDLVYFFVARPAYRTKLGAQESHQLSRFPVGFVFKQSAVPVPYHAYPFDTGGAADGAFDSQADPFVPLEDYALRPDYKSVSKFLGWAFGESKSYLRGRLRSDLSNEVQAYESVAVSYMDIARLGVDGSNEHDIRASAIEISASHNVDLHGQLDLLVAPKQFVEGNEPVSTMIKPLVGAGAKLKLYDWQANRTPNEYQSDIQRIVESWYEEISW